MYTVYVLKSRLRSYLYVGMTNDVDRRIQEHNNGKGRSTQAYRPFDLVYSESADTRKEAREREKYLKSGSGKEFLKRTIKNIDLS